VHSLTSFGSVLSDRLASPSFEEEGVIIAILSLHRNTSATAQCCLKTNTTSLGPHAFVQLTNPRIVLLCNAAQPASRATVAAVVCPTSIYNLSNRISLRALKDDSSFGGRARAGPEPERQNLKRRHSLAHILYSGDGGGLVVPGLLNGARTRPDRSAKILTQRC
jgi:hypothetical protein